MTAFDEAVAIAPLGDGAYSAVIDPAWAIPNGAPNGGYLAAIVVRAMEARLSDPARPARSVTLHYLRAPKSGPVRIDVVVERSGGTLSTLTARLAQGDRLCVLAIGAFAGAFSPPAAEFTAPMPQVAPPEAFEPFVPPPTAAEIARRFEMRFAVGSPAFSGSDEALMGGWMSLREPQPLDAATLALYADAWLPAAFARLDRPVVAPTIDLTVHFRDPAASLAVGPDRPVLGVFRSDYASDGLVEEDGELWSPDGVLLAHSRQLALLEGAGGRVTGYLGLGSNVGDRRANLQAAVDALAAHDVTVTASSATYDTDPVGPVADQPAFLNACVRIETTLAAEELLDACKAVERELGRALPGEEGYVLKGPRPIDVDLLLLGDGAYSSERLTLPHEQTTARRFVLIPLLELDFELRTPDGTRLRDALARMPVDEGVRRAGDPLAIS